MPRRSQLTSEPPLADTRLTTHDAARLLDVNPSTVAKWCDKRGLASHRTAGNHRRILVRDLYAFADAWQIPLRVIEAA